MDAVACAVCAHTLIKSISCMCAINIIIIFQPISPNIFVINAHTHTLSYTRTHTRTQHDRSETKRKMEWLWLSLRTKLSRLSNDTKIDRYTFGNAVNVQYTRFVCLLLVYTIWIHCRRRYTFIHCTQTILPRKFTTKTKKN